MKSSHITLQIDFLKNKLLEIDVDMGQLEALKAHTDRRFILEMLDHNMEQLINNYAEYYEKLQVLQEQHEQLTKEERK